MVKQKFKQLPTSQKLSVVIGISAGALTLAQTFLLGSFLSAGIESNITKSPINFWTLVLGILVIILAVQIMGKK